MRLGENNGHVLTCREGPRADEHCDRTRKAMRSIRLHTADGETQWNLGLFPGAIGCNPPGGSRQLARGGLPYKRGEDVVSHRIVAPSVFAQVNNERVGFADLGPVPVPFVRGSIVVEAIERDVDNVAGKGRGSQRVDAWMQPRVEL